MPKSNETTDHPAQPPSTTDLGQLGQAANGCKACHLWQHATQTVFGEGPADARVMLIGEQPGDQEDRQGRPFVGPAGAILTASLESAGLDRSLLYLTNAVKHFKWTPQGARRLHQKPTHREVAACYPWLQAEVEAVQPELIVCLGATAAQALLGQDFRVTKDRGRFIQGILGRTCFATIHPSAILRAVDHEARHAELARFIEDLRLVADHLKLDVSSRASMR